MLRQDAGFALIAKFVNLCGFRTYNNPETGQPYTQIDFIPHMHGADAPITLEDAMKKWS